MATRFRPLSRHLIALAFATAGIGHAGAASWSPLQPSSHPRSEGQFIVHDGGAFHLNGFDENLRIQNSIERYDLDDGSWLTVAETSDSPGFPNALTHSGVVVIGNELWLIGGRIGRNPGAVTDRVFVFDLDSYDWREGPTLPAPFAGGGAALIDRRIHLIGGLDAQARCDVNSHRVYDLDAPADGWQDLTGSAPFPMPRNHFATVVLDGLIYTIGGQIGHDECSKLAKQRMQTPFVHVYDPVNNDWDRLANLPWAQSHAEPSTFAHAGRLWSVGGLVQGDRVLSYDPESDAWTWREDLELPSDLLAPGARILNGNRLHLFGGGAPDVFNPRTESWVTTVPDLADEPAEDEPVTPQEPITPEEPAPPVQPVTVDDPVAPDGPVAPVEPVASLEPITADDPVTPLDPMTTGDSDAGRTRGGATTPPLLLLLAAGFAARSRPGWRGRRSGRRGDAAE